MPVPHGRAARRPPQTRNGAAPATPSYSLVPPGGFENSPAGKLVARVSTARIRRRPPQTRNGAAPATPSYSLVPPGGFEPSTPALGERCSIP